MRRHIRFPGTLKRIGGTFHVIVPKDYVRKTGWEDGTDVDVIITDPGMNVEVSADEEE